MSISIPADLADHVRANADQEDRTISAEVRRALEAYFSPQEQQAPAGKA